MANDPAYLEWLHTQPCIICEEYEERQMSETQAHHVYHDRFSGRRTPDCMAIPLCEGHHQGLRDKSKLAIHQDKKGWREKYKADHEFSATIRDRYDAAT